MTTSILAITPSSYQSVSKVLCANGLNPCIRVMINSSQMDFSSYKAESEKLQRASQLHGPPLGNTPSLSVEISVRYGYNSYYLSLLQTVQRGIFNELNIFRWNRRIHGKYSLIV